MKYEQAVYNCKRSFVIVKSGTYFMLVFGENVLPQLEWQLWWRGPMILQIPESNCIGFFWILTPTSSNGAHWSKAGHLVYRPNILKDFFQFKRFVLNTK